MDRKVELVMNCTVCGGTLKYENGLYRCENCGTEQQIATFFENTEVFICYVESDSQGRRTKDSVIAQDIYNKLQNAKITTFYQRMSVADLLAEDLKTTCQFAISQSKIIIVCAASKENFITLLDKYREEFTNKKIIPVYASINAYDIPEELGNLQAVNYDNIGALTDLQKNLLHFLGRETEADIVNIAKGQMLKKRKRLIITTCSVLIVLILTISYIVFGTPYILKSKKYSYAEKLVDSGNYTEAINIFAQLENYKNSQDILKSIYDKYEGYYYDETSDSTLHIVIENVSQVNIDFEKNSSEGLIKWSEKGEINGQKISVNFNDNLDNEGIATIQLSNDSIHLTIESNEKIDIVFNSNAKSDAPIKEAISKDTLLSWLQTTMSVNEIKALGYNLEYLNPLGSEEGIFRYYQIPNTDIRLITSAYDTTKESFSSFVIDTTIYNNPLVMAVEGVAELLCPDKIGQTDDSFTDEEFKYYPNGVSYNEDIPGVINNDTPVVVTSNKLLQENEFILPQRWFYAEETTSETENEQSNFNLYD